MANRKSMTVLERIESRAEQQGACRVWTGKVDRSGYGRIRPNSTGTDLVHRAAWIERHGPAPADLVVMHLCDNPPCIEDSHLVLGTRAANLVDMRRKGRRPRPTHCIRGHRLPEVGVCRPCDAIRHREAKARKGAAS